MQVVNYFKGQILTAFFLFIALSIPHSFASDMAGNFSVSEIIIDVPPQGKIFRQDSPLKAHAFIKGTGTGTIFGFWCKNDTPIQSFNISMFNGLTQSIFLESPFFTDNYGRYILKIKIQTPNILTSPEIQYMIADAASGKVSLIYPGKEMIFHKGSPTPTFSWTDVPEDLGYKIAISNSKNLKDAKWISTKTNRSYFKIFQEEWDKLSPDTYYWAVKPVYLNNIEGETSEIFYFEITP